MLAAVREAAAEAGIWVHLGSLALLARGGRQARQSRLRDRRSRATIRARYDKIHLFDVDLPTGESWRESAAYRGGERAVVVDTPVGALGLSICYDLRFADLYSRAQQCRRDRSCPFRPPSPCRPARRTGTC